MLFTTESGSIYELNTELKQIRRLVGTKAPTPRQGTDGEWKPYITISEIEVGSSVLIGWRQEGITVQATLTSAVTQVGQGLNGDGAWSQ